MRIDVHPHEVERDGTRAARPLATGAGQRDADDLAADDLAARRRREVKRGAGEGEGADALLERLGAIARRGQHDRLFGDEFVVVGCRRIVAEHQIGGVGERGRELDMRRVDDDRVVGLATDKAGDRRAAVGSVDERRPVGEAVRARVGELIGPRTGRRHGRGGREGGPSADDWRERLTARTGTEPVETGGSDIDRGPAVGGGKLDRLGVDELDEIPLARHEAAYRLAAVGGVDNLLALGEAVLLGEHELVRAIDVDGARRGVKRHLPGGIEAAKALAAPRSGRGEGDRGAGNGVFEQRGELDRAAVDDDHEVRRAVGEPADRRAPASAVDHTIAGGQAMISGKRDRVAGDRDSGRRNRCLGTEHGARRALLRRVVKAGQDVELPTGCDGGAVDVSLDVAGGRGVRPGHVDRLHPFGAGGIEL